MPFTAIFDHNFANQIVSDDEPPHVRVPDLSTTETFSVLFVSLVTEID
jgi:hypothetical protein